MIKLPIFILMWALYICIKLPTALLGIIVGPFLFRYRDIEYSKLPGWTKPWANPEDWLGQQNHWKGGLPKWWGSDPTAKNPSHRGHGTGFKSWYVYNVIRNPANGLRSFEFIDLDIDSSKVEYKTNHYLKRYEPKVLRELNIKTTWYIAWQGLQAGIKIIHIWSDDKHLVIKFGWRVEPSDTKGIDKGIGTEDASFASKFLFRRAG